MTVLTDEVVFSTVPRLTTCSPAKISWIHQGTIPVPSSYPLVVTNIGVDQGDLSRREYPLVPRQSTAAVNMALLMILSCLVASSQCSILLSSTPSVTLTSTPSPSITSPTPVSGNSSANKAMIAGGIVSAVVVLALTATVALWVSRRRKTITQNSTPSGSVPRTKGQTSKGFHNSSDSTGAILRTFSGGNQEAFPQMSVSEEDLDSEKFAVAYDDIKPNPPPVAATRPYPESSTSSRRPVSMTVKPSFEYRETVQSKLPRQPRRSLDSSMVLPAKTIIPPSPPSLPQYPSDRTRRSSRKPVPAYDPNEFLSPEANDIPLSGRSETSLGYGKPTYYIIPDVPLEQRK